MDNLTTVLGIFGAILISAMMFAIPILTTLSFVFDWNGLVKTILVMAILGEFALCVSVLIDRADM